VLAPTTRATLGRAPSLPVPTVETLGPVGRKWGAWLLLEVQRRQGATFTELLRANPELSPRILSIRLRELTNDRLLRRQVTGPVRTVRYTLGPLGAEPAAAAGALLRALDVAVGVANASASSAAGPSLEMTAGADLASHRSVPAQPVRPGAVAPVEYRPACQSCGISLPPRAEAHVCSYGCTWCPACATRFAHLCPNCGGALRRRPIRVDG
jgi:DNA-binding HxlR family transcriptional regulator